MQIIIAFCTIHKLKFTANAPTLPCNFTSFQYGRLTRSQKDP